MDQSLIDIIIIIFFLGTGLGLSCFVALGAMSYSLVVISKELTGLKQHFYNSVNSLEEV